MIYTNFGFIDMPSFKLFTIPEDSPVGKPEYHML